MSAGLASPLAAFFGRPAKPAAAPAAPRPAAPVAGPTFGHLMASPEAARRRRNDGRAGPFAHLSGRGDIDDAPDAPAAGGDAAQLAARITRAGQKARGELVEPPDDTPAGRLAAQCLRAGGIARGEISTEPDKTPAGRLAARALAIGRRVGAIAEPERDDVEQLERDREDQDSRRGDGESTEQRRSRELADKVNRAGKKARGEPVDDDKDD